MTYFIIIALLIFAALCVRLITERYEYRNALREIAIIHSGFISHELSREQRMRALYGVIIGRMKNSASSDEKSFLRDYADVIREEMESFRGTETAEAA